MIFSEGAATYVQITGGRALFDLVDRVAVAAYVDITHGDVWCPAHRDQARGEVAAQPADDSAMDDARCDSPGCGYPIAAVMLAAYAARYAPDCYHCRRAYLNIGGAPARPCLAHTCYRAGLLAAIVDGSPRPAAPSVAVPAPFVSDWRGFPHGDAYDNDGPGVFARRVR